ncbi:hypothetical protein DFH09DRAFT_1283070 [Mycena vulgaris]|nr:hypothetical protein DFH09DRAFT_1283070 [Mycena vulgaris]
MLRLRCCHLLLDVAGLGLGWHCGKWCRREKDRQVKPHVPVTGTNIWSSRWQGLLVFLLLPPPPLQVDPLPDPPLPSIATLDICAATTTRRTESPTRVQAIASSVSQNFKTSQNLSCGRTELKFGKNCTALSRT